MHAAQEGSKYAGLQYALVTYEEDGFDDVEPTALVGRIGQFTSDNFAIEGRLGFGLQDDTIDVGPFDLDLEVNSLFGVYGVLQSSPSNGISVYGILGFSRVELEATALGVSVSDDDTGLSYGFGLNLKGFNVEYMSYLDEDDYQISALSLGFVAEF